jgi:hypothetical protein
MTDQRTAKLCTCTNTPICACGMATAPIAAAPPCISDARCTCGADCACTAQANCLAS